MTQPGLVSIFIAYSRSDAALLDELRKQFAPLERVKKVKIWYDGNIEAGRDWEAEIKQAIYAADIILLLVSADSISSEYFYGKEVEIALERHARSEVRVLPLILRPCAWQVTPLGSLQALPKNGWPVASTQYWPHRDDAWENAIAVIDRLADDIITKKKAIQKGEIVRQTPEEKRQFATPKGGSKPALTFLLAGVTVLSLVVFFALKKYCTMPTQITENPLDTLPSTFIDPFQKQMVYVQGGMFTMGNNDIDDAKPPHSVTVPSFKIGKYEVTQVQWRAVMRSDPPELRYKSCDRCPVEGVSWNDVQNFIETLNRLTKKKYRMPTEAEWEYAAQGGNRTGGFKYAGSHNLDSVAWYYGNSGNKTHPVGDKKANELGLNDMSGNVWEWVQDVYVDSYNGAPTDGSARASGGKGRVLRGGSWDSDDYFRVYSRYLHVSTIRDDNIGFRLAEE